ncbi:hypothetical protein [Klebsiella oxytoca]|jgi:hypothetical protein|uniref:hypothetical protein n=1 Tax=Klebsiella oxytoca TaxID=571 RepID=UPI0004081FF7|nr:hypothetical protein [Klebsiella oxytoca]MEC5334363.1 hypothetical protein [Klebsiella oxytoca]HED1537290.1 hypothetical protein [Klebsiella oxytoca]HEJ8673300.1 hypothetical protein [Klebsiella oxytoca]
MNRRTAIAALEMRKEERRSDAAVMKFKEEAGLLMMPGGGWRLTRLISFRYEH